MERFQRVQVESAAELEAWLETNHGRAEGVWLVTFKKHVVDKHLPWPELVAVALCWGWIDSRSRRVDHDRTMVYLSPRKPGSTWSRVNKRLVEELEATGRMRAPGRALVEAAKADGSWTWLDDIEDLVVPPDLEAALAAAPAAQRHFAAFPDSSKKVILLWIKSAKRPETRARRVAETVAKAAVGLRAAFPEG